MFKKIAAGIQYPHWVNLDPRFKKLDLYDRLLNGTFYDHLHYAFYDEIGPQDALIPLEERRPSAQYRLPRMVARWSARKLFAGRHIPRIRHDEKSVQRQVNKLVARTKFMQKMLEAAVVGSVGSVAVTFRVDSEANPENPDVAYSIWKAKHCTPSFDAMGELSRLRIHYIAKGASLLKIGYRGTLNASEDYWFIRDYLPDGEATYEPVRKNDWNPVEGFKVEGARLNPIDDLTFTHPGGFVCGQWFVNMGGGEVPDGACTWEDAIPNSIEIDYTLSQTGRGVRYNCAPQPVIKGEILNMDDGYVRGPSHYLHLEADRKDADGNVLGGASAHLLEMNGSGTEAALKLVEHLRNMALEQISAARRDPEKVRGQLSGRAMEFMDEDSHDLVMELRSQYGEHGALPLLKKVIELAVPEIDASGISFQWPRIYQPTPADIAALIPALCQALDPMEVTSRGASVSSSGSVTTAGGGAPANPQPGMTLPTPAQQLLTVDEARRYLRTNMDMDILDLESDDYETDIVVQGSVSASGTGNDNAPEPLDPATMKVAQGSEGIIPATMIDP